MNTADFKAHHMNISAEDVAGNNGVGRYILLPGSDGRAASIAEHFSNGWVKEHSRRHNFYAGTLDLEGEPVDVAVVATGMGCPSVDIIVNELIRLGARRLLRVGTAGSLQPGRIPIGSIVVASAAVRDEGASRLYMPAEVPALASPEMVAAANRACEVCSVEYGFTGIVHTKDSLYARELRAGPRVEENKRFMEQLTSCGVLASEMETAMLFTLAQVYSQEFRAAGEGLEVEAGTILGIIGDETAFGTEEQAASTTELSVNVGLETIRQRARVERAGS
ncbi:MAG: nucleoside phosphorylase [Spirochaetales bacterium]|nr:nucleoside phosphorylase [Spirochaetales bacterium]